MTSTANPQSNPAPNTSAATSAPSYASAAGATKKQASTPLIATGSNPPVVVGGSSAQNAKPSAPSPVNGRPPITPAVPAAPAVAHGSSNNNMNGNAPDHARKSSVTLSANGPNSFAPNGGPVGGSKPGIQFGYNSPAVAHSTPQATAAPIPIPGSNNQRVPSPAHSPSPIPQPSASGGRPPSGMAPSNAMTFGSLGSDGDRHMRQASTPQTQTAQPAQPGSHIRRESGVSQHSDATGPNQGPNRQGFQPQGGRGRGFNPHQPPYNANMGFPPNQQYRNGQGRGGMPPAFHPGRPMQPYPNSPQPARSPALAQSQPGTPNMPPAQMHPMPMATPPQYHYPPPNMAQQQVHTPSLQDAFIPSTLAPSFVPSVKCKKKKGQYQTWEKFPHSKSRYTDSSHDMSYDNTKPRRYSKHGDHLWTAPGRPSPRYHPDLGEHNFAERGFVSSNETPALPLPSVPSIDLSPESGNYERLLTNTKQQYGYPPQPTQYDQFGRPMYYNQMGYMPSPPGGPPTFQPGFVPPPYHQPAPTAMSRTSSHSERPSSSTGQPSQPVVVSGTPQSQNAQVKTPVVASSSGNFVRPKKSAAIVIKNAAGEAVDFKSIKTPSSPAPSIQQSKTPPIVTSTPTPPPKSATPSHVRADSQATPKTRQEIQDELRAKIQQAKGGEDKAKEEAEAKAKAAEDEKKAAEAKAQAEAEEKAKEEARKAEEEAEIKRKAEEEEKAAKAKAAEEEKAAAEAKAKAEAEKPVEKAAEKPVEPAADEEDEVERMIREMEEEDARREKEAAEYNAKKKAEKEAQKKADEANKATNAAEADRKLREAEREMERLEEEKERKRAEAAGASVAELLAKTKAGDSEPAQVGDVADKLSSLSIGDPKASTPTEASAPKATPTEKRGSKPSPLNLAPLNTKPVEAPQPSAALQSLKSARFLTVMNQDLYPSGISSPNPALNAAVAKKGKTFKYDAQFLLQFQKVFTEQPSTEFHQQVKSLIGDNDGSRSASTPRAGSGRGGSQRGAAATTANSTMGGFRAPSNNVRGTTSAERFAMANAAMGSGGGPVGNMGTFRSFPGPQMVRTPSSSNMGPNSPRTRSARGGGGSRRNDYNAKDAQAAKTMPLTAGMELKPITVSATGWKPTSIGKPSASGPTPGADHMDPEMVQRKVKAALNKMTPEKFDKIADQILTIAGQSKDESDGRTLRQVIQLTFEKATDEAHWASMYAKFCKRMLDTMSPEIRDENIKDKNGVVVSGGALFRKYLLNRCQEEFERGWKVNLPTKPEEVDEGKPQSSEAAMLSDEYYIAAAAKRRGLGLVQFIGELYKLGMLTERIMHECVRKLVDYEGIPDEAEIESLSKLLRTIGSNLDASDKGKALMNVYFDRIQHMMDMPELASRLKFMLLDVIDLRKGGWASKEANKGPKTLDEIRAEAEAAALQKAQENQRGGSQRGPGGRPNMGRGDSRNFSSGYMQAQSNQVGMDDLRRLKGSTNRAASGNISLGPTSMFSSRSNSGRRLGPGGSLGRPGEDSGASSRTGTPPTTQHTNAFSALANLDSENPASPPSTAASPALSKAVPDSTAAESK
ncbi:Translation initiation factor 4F [Colletotrichum higginsianum IMI 349063]|uniref:Translation initiation factor 4F n=1 Tax=Colletotrichum higginsianum (strain IMI 349063) TaxID=759273 RepID=A0A1B7YP24_COLHI|nr:Translation initiation factor 4F [Colletotrichum higginsianum IMI 349063]OBR13811.1 Translation initiation factor 4F [Colletotrichum higginsianum IMI 349063]